jgi:formiminotetrahydrofolate cyclodeaminase
MTPIQHQPVTTFLDALASSAATPGGGSAAAIMGSMGAALISMVCNLTLGKKAYAEVDGEMKALLEKAEALRGALTDAVRADVEAFDGLMAAYGLPKDDEARQAARSQAIQASLKQATDAPLACAHACADVIALSLVAAEKGNRNVVSDAGVAALAAQAALRSAALNVDINLPGIKDADFAGSRRADIDALLARWVPEADHVVSVVKTRL